MYVNEGTIILEIVNNTHDCEGTIILEIVDNTHDCVKT